MSVYSIISITRYLTFNLFSAFMRDPFSEKWKISEEMKGVEPSERRNRPTSKEKGYKNWRPELVQSSEILTIDPDLIWQKFGTFGRYQVYMCFNTALL